MHILAFLVQNHANGLHLRKLGNRQMRNGEGGGGRTSQFTDADGLTHTPTKFNITSSTLIINFTTCTYNSIKSKQCEMTKNEFLHSGIFFD